jgi:hypothetical protein
MPVPPVPVCMSGSTAVYRFSYSVFIKELLQVHACGIHGSFLTAEDKLKLKID